MRRRQYVASINQFCKRLSCSVRKMQHALYRIYHCPATVNGKHRGFMENGDDLNGNRLQQVSAMIALSGQSEKIVHTHAIQLGHSDQ